MPIGLSRSGRLGGLGRRLCVDVLAALGGVARVPALLVERVAVPRRLRVGRIDALSLAQGDLGLWAASSSGLSCSSSFSGSLVIVRRALRADTALHNPPPHGGRGVGF